MSCGLAIDWYPWASPVKVNLAYSISAMEKEGSCEWDGVRNREANKVGSALNTFEHNDCNA